MRRHIIPRLTVLFASLGIALPAGAESALATLIQNGDRAAALESIASGADVNARQGDGTTPLHWAVYRIDAALVAALLARGAAVDVTNDYGSSPLAEAVKIGDTALVATLLEAGADPESPNADGQTALMLAARAGVAPVAEQLLAHGADVNARESWRNQTALMWAADARAADVVELLIAHGADIEARARANDWPVQITSEPRAQYRPTGGLTPLLYAARSGCTRCVDAIVGAGADVNRPNPDGVTPLMIALDNFAFDAANLLLDHGANPQLRDWWGRTALYVAVDTSSYKRRRRDGQRPPSDADAMDVVRRLLAAGVDANPQLNMHRPGRGSNSSRFVDDLLTTGATPLLRAAIGHDRDAVSALLAHGAEVDLPNVMGVTPLMAAAGMGVSPRDRRFDDSGDVERRAIATLELLLAAGADINARVTDIDSRNARIARPSTMTERAGQTALYGAVKWAWADVVAWLLEHGADADVSDALGKTPLDAAVGDIGGRDNTPSDAVAELLSAAGGRRGD